MASSDVWADYQVISWVDPEAFLFMGADPSWTPAREEKLEGCEDAAPQRCHLCGGSKGEYLKDAWGNLLYSPTTKLPAIGLAPQIERGSHAVCARCMRYGRPWEIERRKDRLVRHQSPQASSPPKPEPPKVAEKVIPGRGTITVPEEFSHLLGD
jgi:hypothetical protein